ncbi:hypothetical protein KFL_000100660 [Klebsormidium nitens]|uniref:Uncharacterized protein n=1 Tax=Klebsormidium nitens TaxID=105231 RepID=A0A1Y1HMS7_KLENI|nr:hypothetical protein KFL_000100660 [Klebsormidium nitens]|eukprot:GAQ78301.1 hypothetical protein KFL_000100660 [Klebsormidium nitens]
MFRSSVETKQRRELLFEVHEKVADIATQIANEPSVGLYYVQQHVQKAVPALVDAKKQVAHGRDITNFVGEDVKTATTTIQGMKESPASSEGYERPCRLRSAYTSGYPSCHPTFQPQEGEQVALERFQRWQAA